ncbi:MAG: ABC transporter ATP-binding protein [Mycoplasmataceae bacterium]|jgi:ABC-2 type transport system ATP-binding protein|nr:ABC transporter ATP-binding protein [Mycoplasmataceae bacterium]
MAALKVENLSFKTNKQDILKNVSFEVEKGSLVAFIGSNGAGKTTTIKCIVGLYPYTQGVITIDGINVKDETSRLKLGYVPEKENFPKIKTKQFLNSCIEYFHISNQQRDEIIAKLSKLFKVEELLNKKLPKLSSGQKKKILIMQALLHDPDLLIMDEPTENMDPDARLVFYDIIKAMKNVGKTIFISTHNLDEIQKYADHVIVIKSGEIQYSGSATKSDLYKVYEQHTEHPDQAKEAATITAEDIFQKK